MKKTIEQLRRGAGHDEKQCLQRSADLNIKINPLPPTAAEFAQTLISIEKDISFDDPDARDKLFNLIERARAAGML